MFRVGPAGSGTAQALEHVSMSVRSAGHTHHQMRPRPMIAGHRTWTEHTRFTDHAEIFAICATRGSAPGCQPTVRRGPSQVPGGRPDSPAAHGNPAAAGTIAGPRFQPLGHHLQAQAAGQADDGGRDLYVVAVVRNIAHEALVDLELVDRETLEVGQRGIAVPKSSIDRARPRSFRARSNATGLVAVS